MNHDPQQCLQQLSAQVNEELQCANQLLVTMEEESTSIANHDSRDADISKTLERKQSQVKALQDATARRVEIMTQYNFEPNKPGIEQCVNWCDQNNSLRKGFDELYTLARRCFAENQLVGQLANRRAIFLSRAIDTLRQVNEGQPCTYQPNGSTNNFSRSQELGHA